MLSNSAVITDPRGSTFAVLDVGSTKIVCLCVRVGRCGTPEITGVGYRVSEGISGGSIINKHDASRAILSSIDLAEQLSGQAIHQIYVSVAGCGVRSHILCNESLSEARNMSERDIRKIMLQSHEKLPEDHVVIHNIPIMYQLDSLSSITDVDGLYGSHLRADMHVVTASKLSLVNIENCIRSNTLHVGGYVTESYASGISCLSDDEKELGTMIVDIGGNYTSVGVFHKGKFVYAGCIPLGGMHITRDMAYGLCISMKDAEILKERHGSAAVVADTNVHSFIEVTGVGGDVQHVLKSDMIEIIEPRVEEIFELVRDKMYEQKGVVSKVVVTGGCSKLPNIAEVAGRVLKKQVRCGFPIQVRGAWSRHGRNPSFSSAVGTALLVARTFFSRRNKPRASLHGGLEKVLRWIITKADA
ncbi:cell division protein FtsA [Anaplasma bovis]|uniref:cell division protein FtsA n=1 Tax=Anaplasma bovis TaxID=186733 RepID=UPI002FF3F34C